MQFDLEPLCMIDGMPATAEALLPAATQNFGHITILQMRGGKVRGLSHHLERLENANRELFGRAAPLARISDGLAAIAAARPDATVRVNIFEGETDEHVMLTVTAPVEPDWRPVRFSLVPYERDLPHLKHVGSFGLLLRQRQAQAAGYDGAVFFDRHGCISEATIWNIGFLAGSEVVWPATAALRGITQTLIDEGLAALGVSVRYEQVRIDELARFRAAFLSNSNTYGRPLQALGTHTFDDCTEVSSLIRRAYEHSPMRSVG